MNRAHKLRVIRNRVKEARAIAKKAKKVNIPEWSELLGMDETEVKALAQKLGISFARGRLKVLSAIHRARRA
jgi:hypothetical protein